MISNINHFWRRELPTQGYDLPIPVWNVVGWGSSVNIKRSDIPWIHSQCTSTVLAFFGTAERLEEILDDDQETISSNAPEVKLNAKRSMPSLSASDMMCCAMSLGALLATATRAIKHMTEMVRRKCMTQKLCLEKLVSTYMLRDPHMPDADMKRQGITFFMNYLPRHGSKLQTQLIRKLD